MSAVISALPAIAVDFESAVRDYVDTKLVSWAADPALLGVLDARNAATAALSEGDITALDQTWAAELGAAAHPTIDSVVGSPYADILRGLMASSEGRVTEVIVTDARGLNVVASGGNL